MMAQTIRLLRYGLLLRAALSLIEAVVSSQQSAIAPWLRLIADAPYFVALVLILYGERRGWQSPRYLAMLLTGTVLFYSAEVILAAIVTVFSGADTIARDFSAQLLDRMCRRDDGGFLSGRLNTNAYSNMGIMISIVPPLLGAWLGGGRSVPRWVCLAVGADLVNRLCVTIALGSSVPLRAQLFDFLTQAIVITMICVFAGSLADREREEQRQLQVANRRLAEQARTQQQLAASRERVRMARDLHDTLAHTLAALAVQLETVDAALDFPEPTAREKLARASTLAQEGLQSTRNAIMDLRATQIKDIGLVAALRRHIELIAPHSQSTITFETNSAEPELSDDIADGLYRIAQEALNNVIRHAGETRAVVSIVVSNTQPRVLKLRVQDDGCGFDVSRQDAQRFGLRGMRERAELIGAQMQINSTIGKGTTVVVRLELPEEGGNGEDSRARGG